jgi:6-phosphofructokinase 1
MNINGERLSTPAAIRTSKTMAIVVGGGPAPGINGVIRSATIEAINRGLRVVGFYDGYKWLSRGSTTRVERLTIDRVSRIHYRGGSLLRTSRVNPTHDPKMMDNVLRVLTELEIDYLISIGGDDTAYTAREIGKMAGDQVQVVHVPKTIDNDLPLPGQMLTFGYQTARQLGAKLVENIMEDAFTSMRWYFVVTMGRKAGHLALGIGNAAGATMTIIAEEFRGKEIRLSHVCDILEGAIIKRRLLGREYGVAVLSEGLIEAIEQKDLVGLDEFETDAHGNVRYSEISLAQIVKDQVRKRLQKRGIECTIVNKNIGYELRSQPPNSFDMEYTQNLGYSAVRYLLSGGSGAMIALRDGGPYIIPLGDVIDPVTGRIATRMVDVDNPYYKMCRDYMIRLEPEDFADSKRLSRMARVGGCTSDEFRAQFGYLADNG